MQKYMENEETNKAVRKIRFIHTKGDGRDGYFTNFFQAGGTEILRKLSSGHRRQVSCVKNRIQTGY